MRLCSTAGSLKFRPSSPPVKSESCEARIWKNDATARVIMAKKIALTRSESRPMAKASTIEKTRHTAMPSARLAHEGPSFETAIATP
jgi:hypothetical protein